MTTKRHDERYKRAIARITPERRTEIEARTLKELGLVAMPTDVFKVQAVERLIAHKLGMRRE